MTRLNDFKLFMDAAVDPAIERAVKNQITLLESKSRLNETEVDELWALRRYIEFYWTMVGEERN